jgi:hypothetical protein
MEQWLKIKIMVSQVLENGKLENSQTEQSAASEDEEEEEVRKNKPIKNGDYLVDFRARTLQIQNQATTLQIQNQKSART